MKLSKVNKNGSLSVILPKAITTKLDWKEQQIVNVITETSNSLVISKQISQNLEIEQILTRLVDISKLIECTQKLIGNDDTIKATIKRLLLKLIEDI